MGRTIAVMNTKGGVGKSTLVMAMAETLSVFHGKNVLVIDSDSQTSTSLLLMHLSRWEEVEQNRRTLVHYLTRTVFGREEADWREHVVSNISDIDDANSLYLVPSHMQLTLFEREVSSAKRHSELRAAIRTMLDGARQYFDVILIDCPPGISVVTECWLRESDYYLPPTKPDFLSVRGLEVLKRFRAQDEQRGFADLIGVLINMKQDGEEQDELWHRRLVENSENRCFSTAIPHMTYIQRAAIFDPRERTYQSKYPGAAGASIRSVTSELVRRLEQLEAERPPAAPAGQTEPELTVAPAGESTAPPVANAPPRPHEHEPQELGHHGHGHHEHGHHVEVAGNSGEISESDGPVEPTVPPGPASTLAARMPAPSRSTSPSTSPAPAPPANAAAGTGGAVASGQTRQTLEQPVRVASAHVARPLPKAE